MSGARLFVGKDTFKFSCAHMTVFPDGTKERLHGHNYLVALEVELEEISFDKLVDFAPIKKAIAGLCQDWRERTLLAEKNPHFRVVARSDREIEFTLCGDRYVLPASDVLLLPIENVSVEELADHIASALLATLAGAWPEGAVRGVEVTVYESPGQGAKVYRTVESAK